MAGNKTKKKVAKKKGRPKVPQRRLGKLEKKLVGRVKRRVKSTKLNSNWASSKETTINAKLIAHLKQKVPEMTNTGIGAARLVGETFRPECCVHGSGAHKLLAIECKRMGTDSKYAKQLFKEGLAQCLLYLRVFKVAFLVIYDFTPTGAYAMAFAPGNRVETQLAGVLRKQIGLHVMVLCP